jgi:hypothetical protein
MAEGGRAKAALFALGWTLTIVVLTLVAALVIDAADDAGASATEDGVNIAQIVIGLAFFALAWKSWRSRPDPNAEQTAVSRQVRMLDRMSRIGPLGAFGFGLLQGVAIVKNIPLALSGGARIGEAELGGGQVAAALIIFGLVASVGMIALVVVAVVGGSRLDPSIASLRTWLEDNMVTISIVVMLMIGAFLLGKGLAVFG